MNRRAEPLRSRCPAQAQPAAALTIQLSRKGSIFETVAQQVAGSRSGRKPDYRLSFESARSLIERAEDGLVSVMDKEVGIVADWIRNPKP